MMSSEGIRHISYDRLNIGMSSTSFLLPINISDVSGFRGCEAYIDHDSIRRLFFPRSMYHFDCDQSSNIFIELFHQEIHIEHVIELPAFAYHGIPEDIT